MAEAIILDTITTSNTAGEGHDCPVEVTFRLCNFDNFDTEETQIKSLKITPDEKIMPGARVYSNLPAEITDGNELKKAMKMVETVINKTKNLYVIAYDLDVFFRVMNSNYNRLFADENGQNIDTSGGFELDPKKSFSIKAYAKCLFPPTEVGTSYAAEAMMMHLLGAEKFKEERRRFDSGQSTRSVYNQAMDSFILRKLTEKAGDTSFQAIVDRVNNASETMFTFGKHSGKLVADVFKDDFGYCLWCFKNKELMESNPGLQRELARLMIKQREEIQKPGFRR